MRPSAKKTLFIVVGTVLLFGISSFVYWQISFWRGRMFVNQVGDLLGPKFLEHPKLIENLGSPVGFLSASKGLTSAHAFPTDGGVEVHLRGSKAQGVLFVEVQRSDGKLSLVSAKLAVHGGITIQLTNFP